jgi:CBS domain-containing protein
MEIGAVCCDSVVVASRDTSVVVAAQLMRRYHVGAVVVVDVRNAVQVPVGVVTDRDIVVGVVAMNLKPSDLTVADIMTEGLATIPEESDVYDAIRKMRQGCVRRMPVVDAQGALTGIVSLDDLLPLAAQELADLARLPLAERKQEFEFRH